MAVLVALAFGGIGSAIFGAGTFGAQAMFLAGSLIGNLIFPNKSPRGGPKLTDLHVTASTYGKAIQWGWGTARVDGNIIYAGQLVPHKHSSSPFGKGGLVGGPSTYTYSWSGGVGLCSTEFTGPIQKVLKIWADTKLVYDATGQSGLTKNVPGNGGGGKGGGGHHSTGQAVVNGGVTQAYNKLGHFRVLLGTQDQMPDPVAEHLFGAANVNGNRGMALVVFDDCDMNPYGNRVPNWNFEVQFSGPNNYTQDAFKFIFDTSVVGAPSGAGVAIDTFRQRAYFFHVAGASTVAGIHAMDLKTGTEVMFSTFQRTFAPLPGSPQYTEADAAPIVADDGYLWIWSNEANYGPWIKIDPDSLLAITSIGTANSFTPIGGATTLPFYAIPLKFKTNCLFVAGETFTDLTLIDLDGRGPISTGTYTDNKMKMCGGNQIDDGSAEVFALGIPSIGGGTTLPLNLYQITADYLTGAGSGGTITPHLISAIHPADVDSEWSHFTAVSYFVFDSTDGNVMVFVQSGDSVTSGHFDQYLIKISTATGGIMWKMPYHYDTGSPPQIPGNPDDGSYQTIISTGIFSWIDSIQHKVWSVSTQDGVASQNQWDTSLVAGYQGWADPVGAILFHGNYTPKSISNEWGVLVTSSAAGGETLATIVGQIGTAVGYLDPDQDVSTLTDIVPGYVIADQMTAADAIKPLALAYLFDGVESDYVMKYVKRGGTSAFTVPSTSLGYVDTKKNSVIQETRAQEIDLPRQISLTFIDPNRNYQQSTQYARRPTNPFPTMHSKAQAEQSIPIVEEPEFMRRLAEKILFSAWVERVSYKTMVAWDFLTVDPTDVGTLTYPDGSTVIVRITNNDVGVNLTSNWQSVAQSGETYVESTATADGGNGFVQQSLIPTAPSKLFLMDMPLLQDTDDLGQSFAPLYEAASAYGTTYAGTTVLRSLDNALFSPVGVFDSTMEVPWGVLTTTLGDTAHPFAVDYTNVINVMMVTGADQLSSATLLQVCNGANAVAIYSPRTGVIEIVQFLTKTVNGDGSLTLSGLLRGRRGTEVYTGTHASGEQLVLLTAADVQAFKMARSDMNVVEYYKAPSIGTLEEAVDSVPFTDTGRAWKPYAPVQQTATLSGSDIDLAWVRRTRVGGELADFTGIVPLAEQAESYEVDIYNALGDTVLRTLRVDYGATPTTSPGVTYLAADIATDFGSTPTTLNVAIYQISTVIGRGFGKLVNLTVM